MKDVSSHDVEGCGSSAVIRSGDSGGIAVGGRDHGSGGDSSQGEQRAARRNNSVREWL